MTSEDGEMWKAVKIMKQKKRASNRENSSALLEQSEIPFTSHNAGAHLVVEGRECFIDFWPGTGRWASRDGKKGFGIRNLLEYVK